MFPEHLHLKKVCGVMWACTGPADRAEAATKPMRSVGKPLLDHQAEMPLPVVNSLFDALYPPGLQWYWRADFVKELSDEAIARHAQYGAALPTMHSTMHLYAIDGAAHRVGQERHRVQLSRRQLGGSDRRRRSGSGQRAARSPSGARTTSTRCIRTRPAART